MTIKEAESVLEKIQGPFSFATFMLGIRTTLGLTQVEAAQRLGITRSALCEIEKGRTFVSAEAAVRYAKVLGFSQTVAIEACFQDQLRRANIKKRVRIEDAA